MAGYEGLSLDESLYKRAAPRLGRGSCCSMKKRNQCRALKRPSRSEAL